jgi:hypothetical protein
VYLWNFGPPRGGVQNSKHTAEPNLLYLLRRELYIPLLLLELHPTIRRPHQIPQSWRLGLAHIQVQLQLGFLQKEEFVDLRVYFVGAASVEEVHQVVASFVAAVPHVAAASSVGVVYLAVVESFVDSGSQLALVGVSFLLDLVGEHLAVVFPDILVAGLGEAFGVVLEEGVEDPLVVAFAAFGDALLVDSVEVLAALVAVPGVASVELAGYLSEAFGFLEVDDLSDVGQVFAVVVRRLEPDLLLILVEGPLLGLEAFF